ncbi:MAG: mannose/fructose/sorbose PTS transporter subunit IIB [Cardiobacteriaceae bacterium]|nr:mannose/fructose/sorbose PTS transporter subunit IIB [Cardiobacteriaceae bacterium]
MVQIIVACHGKMGEEIVQTAAMVFGDLEGVHAVSFVAGEGPEDLIQKYEAIMEKTGQEVLFLVDLFGGSPYNAAVRLVAEREQADVLTGVNLPMLLEILDSRDEKSTVADLVQSAHSASIEGIKAFRTPIKALSKEKAVPNASEEFDHRKGRPTSGNMKIALLRIDSRLIHGQVATSWAKAVHCDAIFAVSDEVANDELRSKLLLQVAPAHLQSYVITVDKAIKVYHNPMYADRSVLWLVTNPSDIVRLVEGGVKITEVNVGGMNYRAGDQMVSQAVAVNAQDVQAFKRLDELGVKLTIQQLANHSPEPLMPKLANLNF